MLNHDLSVYQTCQAPPPETLYWPNLRWRSWERRSRSTLIWVAFWALAVFYVRPRRDLRLLPVVPACSCCQTDRHAGTPTCQLIV